MSLARLQEPGHFFMLRCCFLPAQRMQDFFGLTDSRGWRPDYARSRSLPFLDSWGSVQAERLKQQGLRLPLFIFEMVTSTRRWRVSGLLVALTQRTHSQRAIGVMAFQRSWIFSGAAARAV